MKKSVMCILPTVADAERAVDALKAAGFSNDDISALFPNKQGTKDFAHEMHTKAPEGALAGASAGGAVGGALGVLAGVGLLVIPGLGPFIAAGPLIGALSGAAAGAAVGGLAGGLVGMGIPELEAKRFEGKVRDGNILLSVHTEGSKEVRDAEQILRNLGGQEVCTSFEASVPSTESQRDLRAL